MIAAVPAGTSIERWGCARQEDDGRRCVSAHQHALLTKGPSSGSVGGRVLGVPQEELAVLRAEALETPGTDAVGKPDGEATPGGDTVDEGIPVILGMPRTAAEQHAVNSLEECDPANVSCGRRS